MKLTNSKIGDKYFGIIYKYNFRFMKGIKLVQIEVVKINPKTIGIAWDKESRKYPQLMKKNVDNHLVNKDAKKLLQEYMKFLNTSTFPKYLQEKIKKYCLRKMKELDGVKK